MRVEWSKSHERIGRWREEKRLSSEEMRRTLQYFDWAQNDWFCKATKVPGDLGIGWQGGAQAYMLKQADNQVRLKIQFQDLWKNEHY